MGRYLHAGLAGRYAGLAGIRIVDQTITTALDNADLVLEPDGTGKVSVAKSTGSTSTSTGALVVTGGVGVGENLYVNGDIEGNGTINGGSF
jgi:hypothetical protein